MPGFEAGYNHFVEFRFLLSGPFVGLLPAGRAMSNGYYSEINLHLISAATMPAERSPIGSSPTCQY